MKELYTLVDSIVNSFKDKNFYSEIPTEHLKDIIYEHLDSEYSRMVNELQIYFDIKKMSGSEIKEGDYDLEFAKIKDKLNKKIDEISRIN